MALGLFRMMASIARDMVIANTFGSAALLAVFLLGGFIIPKGELLSPCDGFEFISYWLINCVLFLYQILLSPGGFGVSGCHH